jgi:hypothetical protein
MQNAVLIEISSTVLMRGSFFLFFPSVAAVFYSLFAKFRRFAQKYTAFFDTRRPLSESNDASYRQMTPNLRAVIQNQRSSPRAELCRCDSYVIEAMKCFLHLYYIRGFFGGDTWALCGYCQRLPCVR